MEDDVAIKNMILSCHSYRSIMQDLSSESSED